MRNKYPGKCCFCKRFVDKGKGHPERGGGRWLIRCTGCVKNKSIAIKDIMCDDIEAALIATGKAIEAMNENN